MNDQPLSPATPPEPSTTPASTDEAVTQTSASTHVQGPRPQSPISSQNPSSHHQSADVTEPSPTAQQPPKKEGGLFSFFATILAGFVIAQLVIMFLFQSYQVYGNSMVPTLHNGDRLIISKIGKTSSRIAGRDYQPARGDIIVFAEKQRPEIQIIKRVIGLPGERVVVKNGTITVFNDQNPQGFNPDPSFGVDFPTTSGEADVVVPDAEVFVSGDNREGANSLDSRNDLGTVPEDLIAGVLKARIWPLEDARFF